APPVVILMAGLQGAGKTTSVAKLARWLQERAKKSVMVVSTDVYRPAAIDQLETLSNQVGATFWPSTPAQKPVDIAQEAVQAARTHVMDVLIIDTAGRLHIDDEMMLEIKQLHEVVRPTETLFVVDAMTGQDAVNTAKVFNDALPLTGVILTKADGDARGGAALSVKAVTGKPIKFLGVGEKNDALEPFYPDRMASRILGMGDVLTLVEEAERKLDKKKADRLASKLKKGRGFDLEDMLEQFQQMKKMGGIASMLDKLPGMGGLAKMASAANSEGTMKQVEAIILSMTIHERRFPDVISGSRKRRIAAGSGMEIQDVNRLLKQYKQMQKVMKKFGKKGGMKSIMRSMEGMMGGGGGLPPGFGR
ncbi:MAG: AAA family ATPase, partial [Gammaproteobacteria bacterium]